MDEKDSDSVQVVDKRRFTSGGELKEKDEATVTEPKAEPKDDKAASSSAEQVAAQKTEQESQASSDSASTSAAGPVDFSSFIVSLATQTLMMLGEIPHPETNQRMFNLEAAQQTIDLISMLAEKTSGNLMSDEDKMIQEVLSSLKLSFVKHHSAQGS